MDALIQSLVQANFAPERIVPQAPMAQYTTLRIGGPAEVMVNIHSADEIAVALRAAKQADAPVTIIGNGSNLLVRDGGIRGLVLRISGGLNAIRREGDCLLVQAGASLAAVAAVARDEGLSGMAELGGIPGTVGGGVLMNAGAVGTAIEDRYDVTSSKKSDGMWDMIDEDVLKHMSEDVLVKAYFKSDASAPETLHLVEQKLGEIAKMDMGFDMGSLTLDTQGVREQDWAENWKKYYKPFRAGERLVIKPSWEAYEPKAGDLVLELDPGMAFGTGTHETTFMCMEQLEKYVTPGCRAIDVGCGSGILGLAAAKLGAADVLAIDLDELAVKVAAENTEKNGLSNVVRVAHGDLLEKREEKADVIVANIIADVICYLCGPVKKHLLEGGTFICSGIIREREEDVQRALAAAGYTVCNRLAKGEWVCLAAKLTA